MSSCDLCGAPKSVKTCGECEAHVCKNCVKYLEQDRLRFHPELPAFTKHGVFCADCFDYLVQPELEKYDEVLARSEQITIVRSSFRGYIPCFQKADGFTEVKDDAGKGIAVWRLKFLAAWHGYDSIIELEAEHHKHRNFGWESKAWSARGQFANIDHKRFHPPEESD